MYSVPQNEQLTIFLCSLGMGFLLGVLYDVVRAIRLLLTKSKYALIFFDVFYFGAAGVLTFLFILAMNKGEIRSYILFGELIGFLFYYFSLGIVAVKATSFFVTALKKLFSLFKRMIFTPLNYIKSKILYIFEKIIDFFKKTFKKSEKIQQKHLPKLRLYVYNLLSILFVRRSTLKKGGSYFGNTGKKGTKEG